MTSVQIDIKDGLSSSVAIKGPVKVATTANITLSGQQTIDGVAIVTDDRVLVKDQTTASENGIYVADTGSWRRSKDFNKTRDVKTGTLVLATGGSTNAGMWQVTTSDPISIGTTGIAFGNPVDVGFPNPAVANTYLKRNAGNTAYAAITAIPSSDVTNTQTGTGAASRTVQNKFTEQLSVKDFGATGDGTTDDSAAIQLAETARAAAGAELIFPPGTYLFDGQTINRANGGGWRGIGQAKLIPNANSVVMIDISGAVISSSSPVPFSIVGLRFGANGKTGITAIRESAPYFTSLSGLSFTGDLSYCAIFTGSSASSQTGWVNIDNIHQRGAGTWVFQGFDDTHYIFNININNLNQQGTGASTWSDQKMFKLSRAVSVYLNNVNAASLDGGADGISMVGDCQGVFLNNVIIGWPKVGIIAQVGTDTLIPSYVYMSNVGMDQPVTNGMLIHGRTWLMRNINATNGYLRSSTGSGILIKSDSTDIDLSGALCAYMNHAGFEVETGAAKVRVSGLTAENNNQNAGANKEINLNACSFKDVKLFGKNVVGSAGVTATGQRLINGRTSETVSVNVTGASTTAVITAEDLMTYSIPAAALQVGQRVRIKAWGTTAANANTKTGRVFFGASSMGGWSSTLNAVGWEVTAEVIITGASAQTYVRKTVGASSISQVTGATMTEATSGAIVVKFQGQNGVATAADITCQGLEVEILD